MKKIFILGLIGLMGLMGNYALAQLMDPAKRSFSVKETSPNEAELIVTVKLDKGWHMYSQHTDANGPLPTVFEFTPSSDYQLVGKVAEPKPHEEMDPLFGCVVKSFEGTVVFRQKIKRLSDKDFTVKGLLSYQLCNDGSCIAPEDHDMVFKVKGAAAQEKAETEDTAAVADTAEATDTVAAAVPVVETPSHTETVSAPEEENEEKHSLLGYFLIALGGGILTMFTPCVFPMIPMTVNFFMHGSENKRKGRRQAWFFGLSIVLIFAVIGVVLSAIFGPEVMNTIATNWIPNLIFFAIFFIFALSFFGLFEIKMPEKWVNASDEQADKGGFLAPFFIALTTVLVSFSCTGPIIAAALAGLTTDSGADAETANRWVSLITMLGFGIGFALPFTLLAIFPQFLKNMKSGSWLNTVKVSFAFIELAFGLKFLQMADIDRNWGLLPRDIYLALWIVIFALWGFYLLGKLRFKGDDEVQHIGVGRLMLAILDFAFVVYMIPGLWGAELKTISGFVPPMSSQDFTIQKIVHEYSGSGPAANADGLPMDRKYADKLHVPLGFEAFFDLDEAKAYARKVNKPIFIDFTGKNCANCREMEHYVWPDEQVKTILNNDFVMVSLYCDENTIELPESEWVTDDKGHVLKTLGRRNGYYQRKTYNMNAQPYYVIIDADGRTLTKENHKYDRDVQKFVDWLNEGKNNFNK
ncbi:MAG: thioredoxin family protein [Bacteroidales bacterium]|nr:thioredoxin family protein [Bacteroidales bacterium]